jgi:hypothetical protein
MPASGTLTAASATGPTAPSFSATLRLAASTATGISAPGLFGQTNNLGELFTDGVDLIMALPHQRRVRRLSWSFTGNWTNSSKFKSNAADPDGLNRECAGHYSVNCSFTGSIQPKLAVLAAHERYPWARSTCLYCGVGSTRSRSKPQQFEDDGRLYAPTCGYGRCCG